jgi:hypothetical protein
MSKGSIGHTGDLRSEDLQERQAAGAVHGHDCGWRESIPLAISVVLWVSCLCRTSIVAVVVNPVQEESTDQKKARGWGNLKERRGNDITRK